MEKARSGRIEQPGELTGHRLDLLCGITPRVTLKHNLHDPSFVDADGPDDGIGTQDDNIRLLAGSPCIDTADNSAVPAGILTDLDGNDRIWDGDGNPPATVDMGAYEYGAPVFEPEITAAVSRMTHDAAGDFDIDLPLGEETDTGVECRDTGAE